MIYGSVCSGIEAASQAWAPLGWEAAFFSEIDRFPAAVLAAHYGSNMPGEPHARNGVPNFGDMTKHDGWPRTDIDVLVGGTPCQSFSIAGLRKGLADDRGNLCLVYLEIARRLEPEWVVWENVPGVLSSNGGRDFGTFLGGLGELGYGFAFRVLDAQYVRVDGLGRAVPQRRRRVFVVGHLGDWRRAAAVLFEPESLSGHSPPRREAGQSVGPTIAARTRGGGGLGTDTDLDGGLIPCNDLGGVSHALTARPSATGRYDPNGETFIAHALRGEGFDASEDGTGRGTPVIAIQERAVSENPESGPEGSGVRDDGAAFTLEARGQAQAVAFSCKDHGADAGETSPTLRAMGHGDSHPNAGGQVAVAFDLRGRDGGAQAEGPHDTANLRAASGGSSRSYVAEKWAVRRLTPTECERLQGFPDGYTRVPWRGKDADQCPDGPRYKSLGNSMAVNVMRWIGQRIDFVTGL